MVADGWYTVQLGRVCTKLGSGATPRGGSNVYINTGTALIRSQNVLNSGFSREGLVFIDDEHAGQLSNVIVEEGDVLLNITGDSVARVCQAPASVLPARVNQHVAILRPNPTELDPRYLRYYLVSPSMQQYMLAIAGAGATRNALTKGMIESFEVPVPSTIEEQRAIGHILGMFDDKIESNRRMSEKLETIARTVFKSWFYDFEPVRAKANGELPEAISHRLGLSSEVLALFPDRFQISELGEIPIGWEATQLGSLCSRVAMGPFGSDIKTSNFQNEGVPVIRGGNLRSGFLDAKFVFVSEAKADELRNANARPEDIVITHRGTLGQIGIIPRRSRFPRYVVSQSQMVLTVDRGKSTPRFVYEFLRSFNGQQLLLANTSQVGVPAIARPTTSVKSLPVAAPPKEIAIAFETLVEPLFDKITLATHESDTLALIRDSLLPKLLSGKLPVPLGAA
jgi:type I restriction enzyme, S subunit